MRLNFVLIVILNTFSDEPLSSKDICSPSPCGSNAVCKVIGRHHSCLCIDNYIGDPYGVSGCRPECVTSNDCPRNQACINNQCKNPCVGVCGTYAVCDTINHVATCSCPQQMTGDPYQYCSYVPVYEPIEKDPCNPSPCRGNSFCRKQGSSATCECIKGYFGNPYDSGCKPECVINSDCPLRMSCSNYKCQDPCVGACGFNAECRVHNHSPICTCPAQMVGNPFISCMTSMVVEDPCYPSPCAENGVCSAVNGKASCHYPECVKNEDCSSKSACFNQKCGNPCTRACGENAICNVINHKAGKTTKIKIKVYLNGIIFLIS